MKKSASLKVVTWLLIMVLISVCTWTSTQSMESAVKRLLSIRITSTRTDSFNNYCADKSFSKANLVDSEVLASTTAKRNTQYEEWGLDGYIFAYAGR